jgi:hypothetical protein
MTPPPYTLSWILPIVRSLKMGSGFDYSLWTTHLWIEMERLKVKGVVKRTQHPSIGQFDNIPPELESCAEEAFWYLLRSGYLAPNSSGAGSPGIRFHRYTVTERGAEWFKGREPLPECTNDYMKFLTDRVPHVDDVIVQYMKEALHAFNGQSYFAAAVMIGAASEKAIYLLAGDMVTALKSAQSEKLEHLLTKRGAAKEVLDFILKVIERHKKLLPSDGAVFQLTALFDAIRTERTAAVHPNTAEVSGDSVRLLTTVFPYALGKSEELRDWLKAHQHSLD